MIEAQNRMRLLFVIDQFHKEATDEMLLNHLRHLANGKNRIDLVVLNQPSDNQTILPDDLLSRINIFNASQESDHLSRLSRKWAKLTLSDTDKVHASALLWIRHRYYDWAVQYGERYSPYFISRCVQAKKKCIWMSQNTDESESFDADAFFAFDNNIDKYLFNTRDSMIKFTTVYPFLSRRSECLENEKDKKTDDKTGGNPTAFQSFLADGLEQSKGVSSDDDKAERVLLIVDDINYKGGAHSAARQMIRSMESTPVQFDIFTLSQPSIKQRCMLPNVHFYSWDAIPEDSLYHRSLSSCLLDFRLSLRAKKTKILMTRCEKNEATKSTCFETFVRSGISRFFSKYHTICVLSEGSALKADAYQSTSKHKIQWVHTDYCEWRNASDYTQKISENDRTYWKCFDKIVLLSDRIRAKVENLYPELAEKLVVIPNFIDEVAIREKAGLKQNNEKERQHSQLHNESSGISFITVCRFEPVKAIPRLLKILLKLQNEGYLFHWCFIGEGEEYQQCKNIVESSSLASCVSFLGYIDNPYPEIEKADVLGLFSYYEGLPNTVYEALVLGVPVCTTDVGGVRDQIQDGSTGWIASNDNQGIYDTLRYILEHPKEITKAKGNLLNYHYDNETIKRKTWELFK